MTGKLYTRHKHCRLHIALALGVIPSVVVAQPL